MARDERQVARDREVDANIHHREAENQVAQLKRDLFKSQDAVLEAQEAARRHEKAYHETLVLLKQAQLRTRLLLTQQIRFAFSRWKCNLIMPPSN